MGNDAADRDSRPAREPHSPDDDPTLILGEFVGGEESPLPDAIGPYPVVRVLGRGGMGVVYAARDARLRRPIAIKVLPERMARDAAALGQFRREARLLAALNHPNIATIYSLEETPEFHFITMELVRGRTLAARLKEGALPLSDVLSVSREIASALEAAHEAGIVHRDVKPANILLTADDHVKMLDFGLARAWGDAEMPDVSGTPGYMSPEQSRGKPVDRATDSWAFASVVFECLAGRKLVPGETPSERLRQTYDFDVDWSLLPSNTPATILSLLTRCLRKEPSDRLKAMSVVRRDIEEEIMRQRLIARVPLASRVGSATPTNLPASISTFVGRRKEITEIVSLMQVRRLLTVVGVGGCGKTRLSLEVAARLLDRFPDGVWFVDLAPLPRASDIRTTVLRAIEIPEEGSESVGDALRHALMYKQALIILDNCEQVVSTCSDFAERLLPVAPGVSLLATSREPLGAKGEAVYRLSPLSIPGEGFAASLDEVAAFDGVRLFVERAREADSTFSMSARNRDAITRICRRLDGMPLGLELAAARVRVLSVEDIAERLDHGFSILTTTRTRPDSRHDTLEDLIGWSYELLSPEERAVFRRLSVFCCGWALSAAEGVCAGSDVPRWDILDIHARLVDKSLVVMALDDTGTTRYRMLETVRDYASGKLSEANERDEVLARHLDYYLAFVESAEPGLRGFEQTKWFRQIAAEYENLRVVFDTCLGPPVDPSMGVRLAGALGRYWMIRGLWQEGREVCARVLLRAEDRPPSIATAKTLNAAGNLAFHQGEYAEAQRAHTAALQIRRRLGDRGGQANSLNNLGEVARMRGEHRRACVLYGAALDIQNAIGDEWGEAVSHNNLGEVAQSIGDYDGARTHHDAALRLWPKLGDRWGVAWSLSNLGFVATRQMNLTEASSFYERSLATSRDIGDEAGVALSLHALGVLAQRAGRYERAVRLQKESLTLRNKLGDRKGIAESLDAFVSIAIRRDDLISAARLLGAAEGIRERIHAPLPLDRRAEIEAQSGNLRRQLGPERFVAEFDQGRMMFLDQAVACALAQVGQTRP